MIDQHQILHNYEVEKEKNNIAQLPFAEIKVVFFIVCLLHLC